MSNIVYEIIDLVKFIKPNPLPITNHINLNIYEGEVFGLLGKNGAGKTTLIRQLVGLSKPNSGSINLFGVDIVKSPDFVSNFIALQPQEMGLPSQATVRNLIEITGQLRGLTHIDASKFTNDILDEFNLANKQHTPFSRLSGGQRRLVTIATTLIGDRPIMIFDEPTNDLDPEIRRVVWSKIRKYAESGCTIILVTHNVLEAESVLDRVGIVHSGQIIALGTPNELKNQIKVHARLEIILKSDLNNENKHLIDSFSNSTLLSSRHISIEVTNSEVEDYIHKILHDFDKIEDFRIIKPNLEDVYIKMSGGERIETRSFVRG
ncbi:ABC transporter ATP-binding protein [Heyndrickxia sp. NPDC080065]|uniref:ABC transporter ATP-binding protein n=1 Tax=Heyndrickxia sp. NPDC080065 TaxID=3390568 RepID=UPI003D00AA98